MFNLGIVYGAKVGLKLRLSTSVIKVKSAKKLNQVATLTTGVRLTDNKAQKNREE